MPDDLQQISPKLLPGTFIMHGHLEMPQGICTRNNNRPLLSTVEKACQLLTPPLETAGGKAVRFEVQQHVVGINLFVFRRQVAFCRVPKNHTKIDSLTRGKRE